MLLINALEPHARRRTNNEKEVIPYDSSCIQFAVKVFIYCGEKKRKKDLIRGKCCEAKRCEIRTTHTYMLCSFECRKYEITPLH